MSGEPTTHTSVQWVDMLDDGQIHSVPPSFPVPSKGDIVRLFSISNILGKRKKSMRRVISVEWSYEMQFRDRSWNDVGHTNIFCTVKLGHLKMAKKQTKTPRNK